MNEEVMKSNLLLEAQLLRAQGQTDAAAVRFAQAAEIDERLAAACQAKGETELAYRHQSSAIGCWAQAGNWHAAITLGDLLLAQPALPDRLRQRVQEYTQILRQRRAAWSAELVLGTV